MGAGARTTTIRALTTRVVSAASGEATLSGVNIFGGNAGPAGLGGGIFVGEDGDLTLVASTVSFNAAMTGGGIYSEGSLTVERSTIMANDVTGATPRGGGLAIDDGDATLVDTTVSGNFSDATGGGLWTAANVELRNVTIAGNEADELVPSGGGGIQQAFDEPGSDRTVAFNTLVADNIGGNCLGTSDAPGQIHARYSMADDLLCNVPQDPGSHNTPVDPEDVALSGLQDNGGPTDTRALLSGSLAIDAGEDVNCESVDQRGLGRPRGAACDIGAYERAPSLTVNTNADDFDGCTVIAGGCGLREAVEYAAVGGSVIVPDGEYALSRGALEIARSVLIVGAGARATTLRGSGSDRVLHVTGGGSIISGVRITGGRVDQGQPIGGPFGGGIFIDSAELSLIDTTVDDNVARAGGGIYTAGGFLTVFGSTISSNHAIDGDVGIGGGLYLLDSFAQLTNSTVSGNSATRLAGAMYSFGTELQLLSSTLANNAAIVGQPAGTAFYRQPGDDGDGGETGSTIVRNTLIAANPGQDCAGAGPIQTTNSITDDASCPGDDPPDAKLGDLANNTGPTDTHALLAGSPAIDAGSNCPPTDQRGVSRPQGSACDVGAFEGVVASPPSGGGGGDGRGGGGDGGGGTQPPPDDGDELPPPEPGEEVNALPKSGTVKVRVRGSNRFVELEEGQQIPVGSVVDTTKGRVTIVAAGNQQADFYDGIFKLGQGKGAKPLTTLTLVEKLSCPKAGNATAAAKKKKRRLWGDGTGKFQTKGKHSAATVVGTKWLVEDKCTSTLTRVARGRVSVRDFVKKQTVIVRAGKKYTARAKKK